MASGKLIRVASLYVSVQDVQARDGDLWEIRGAVCVPAAPDAPACHQGTGHATSRRICQAWGVWGAEQREGQECSAVFVLCWQACDVRPAQ